MKEFTAKLLGISFLIERIYIKIILKICKLTISSGIILLVSLMSLGVFLTGCSVNIGGQQRPLVQSNGINGELEFIATKRTDEQGISGNKRESETTVFEERVRLKMDGDIYHPNFLLFNAAAGFGFAQQQLSSSEVSGRQDKSLNDYSFVAQLLKEKPYSSTFYANKSESLIPRQFIGSLRTELESQGSSLSLKSKEWPMLFQYNTSQTSQDSLTSITSDFFERDDTKFSYSVNHNFSELSRMNFVFDKTDISQHSAGALIETKSRRYTFVHNLIFGDEEQHNLNSFVNFADQTGTYEFENLQGEERLRFQHSSTFLTTYNLRFTNYKRESLTNKEIRGQVGFEHRLYESLVTTATVFASTIDLDDQGDISQQGGTLSFNYRKNNPWGLLLSTYTTSLTRNKQAGGTGIGVVINESHIATELVPVELDRTNIDISSIRVKNDLGLLFQEGEDYTITEDNGRIWLNIITVGGVTPPNFIEEQEFFVDYNFFIEPEREENTLRQIFTIKERFNNGISIYYSHRNQDEKVRSTFTTITPDEFTGHTVGTEYNNKGLFLQAEFSDEESTQIPSRSKKLQGAYNWSINENTYANVRVVNHWLDIGEPDARDVVLFKTGVEFLTRLVDNYSISVGTDYRDENDTRLGTTKGFQVNSELKYNFRQLSITTGVEISLLNRRKDKIEGSFLYFKIKRFF